MTESSRTQVIVANQLATKLLTADNKPANFDTGDRAVLMPQLGELTIPALYPVRGVDVEGSQVIHGRRRKPLGSCYSAADLVMTYVMRTPRLHPASVKMYHGQALT